MIPVDANLNFDNWTTEQKLELIGKLWDSIPPATPPIPEWHWEILDQRLAAREANPDAFVSLEEVMAELRSPQ